MVIAPAMHLLLANYKYGHNILSVMTQQRSGKVVVSVSMSPYLKRRLSEIAEDEKFAGISDLVSYALVEFVTRHELTHGVKRGRGDEREPYEVAEVKVGQE